MLLFLFILFNKLFILFFRAPSLSLLLASLMLSLFLYFDQVRHVFSECAFLFIVDFLAFFFLPVFVGLIASVLVLCFSVRSCLCLLVCLLGFRSLADLLVVNYV